VLPLVQDDVARRRDAGELDAQFDADLLRFSFPAAPGRAHLPIVLVVALPRPAHAVAILHDGRRHRGLLPPTYVRYRPLFEDVRRELASNVFHGCAVELLEVPLKALASRLGLIRYGRNNIAYAPGLGSYVQLYGFATDASLPVDPGWRPAEPRLLDECEDCDICQSTCPTGAIAGERILLHGERCLTYANESPTPLPEWIPASAHHCIVGCLLCQRPCPANPELSIEDTGVVLEEAETAALVAGTAETGPLANALHRKLDGLGLSFDFALLGRNLRALLARRLPH
jgi:epoxyqueuosine reductase